VAHLFAGPITVVARDPNQVARQGTVTASITADWQVAPVPDLVIEIDVGSIGVTVRDPQTGEAIPDCRVVLDPEQASQLHPPEATVSDADGRAQFDALPLEPTTSTCSTPRLVEAGGRRPLARNRWSALGRDRLSRAAW